MNVKRFQWLLVCGIALTLAGAAVPARASVSDAWVSTKVKMRLMNSPHVSGYPIDVDTDEGRVTLHGKVASAGEKTEAGRIARTGSGVTSVRNLLQVVPVNLRHRVNVSDERLTMRVDDALRSEPVFADGAVHVKSVNAGVVLLAGKVPTLSDHLLAIELASSVPGVHQVASEIGGPDDFGDREIWLDPQPADPAHGNAVTDGWITAQTKMRFMTDADVPSGDIHVDTRRGVVTLFGTAPAPAVADRAVHVASGIPGVHSVRDEIRVVAASRAKTAAAQDHLVESAVRGRITDARMSGADVSVEVKDGTARLTGTVQTSSNRYSAVAIAHATPGVDRVQDDLHVAPPAPGTP